MIFVDPSAICAEQIEINEIKISSWNIELSFNIYDSEEIFKVCFTDEEGLVTKEDLAKLYWILFTNPEYQKMIGIFYKGTLSAISILDDKNNFRYIVWNFLGEAVVNCFIGMSYKESKEKEENKDDK